MIIERYFLLTGAVLAALGMCLGIVMGVREDFTLVPVHAHLNLVGWASLALFGLAYAAGLAKKDGWAVLHYWLATSGAVIMPIGIYPALMSQQKLFVIVASLLTLASMLVFITNLWRARFR